MLGLSSLRLGLHARGSGRPFDFYVDSVAGDDGNAGTSAAAAFETISGLPTLTANLRIGLARGGYWDEYLNITSVAAVSVGAFGAGDAPELDGAGPVTETWSQDDAVTYPNVWNITVTHGWSAGGGRMMLWKNGALLKRVASVALVNAEAGTYYSPGDNVWSSATYKVYMHATANPNSDGNTYERTIRHKVINGAYNAGIGSVVRDVIVGRQGDNDGAIALGQDSTMERVLAYDGHKHNALQESGVCRNSAFVNAQPESNYLHVFYTPTATDMEALYEGCVFVGQTNGLRGTSGVYCHDNSGAAHATFTVEGCAFANMGTALSSAAVSFIVEGVYIENCDSALATITGSTSDVSHLLVNKQYLRNSFSAAGTHTVSQSAFYLRNNHTFFQLSLSAWGDITLDHCTVHFGDWDTTVGSYERNIVNRTTGTGTFSATNCIFIMDNTDTTVAPVLKLNTASIGIWDNNVYFYKGNQSKSSLKWQVDGVNKTWAEWQALGHDANSILIDETDITFANLLNGHPANGDFRLKSGLALLLPDNTPVSTLGVQEHYDLNAGAVVAGAPQYWPTMPKTRAEAETYIASPSAWDFYSRGPNVINDGIFQKSGIWTTGTGWTIGSNVATAVNAANLLQAAVLEVGKTYEISIEVTAYTSGTLFAGNIAALQNMGTGTGIKTKTFTATATSFYIAGVNMLNATIDNVSVREVL